MSLLRPQYRDLVEILQLSNESPYDLEKLLNAPLGSPEFAFVVLAKYQKEEEPILSKCGFKNLSCMQNWWPTHREEARKGLRPLSFWWRVNETPRNYVEAPRRKCWGENEDGGDDSLAPIVRRLGSGGCGFKLGDFHQNRITRKHYLKYFALLRAPLDLTDRRRTWLDGCHYRHIATGQLAQFWVNGWPPRNYTPELEIEFWRGFQEGRCP